MTRQLSRISAAVGSQNAGMHRRVERLDAAAEHFWKAGNFSNLGDLQSCLGQGSSCAPAGNQLPTEPVQPLSQINQVGLVVDGEYGTWHRSSEHASGKRDSTTLPEPIA